MEVELGALKPGLHATIMIIVWMVSLDLPIVRGTFKMNVWLYLIETLLFLSLYFIYQNQTFKINLCKLH